MSTLKYYDGTNWKDVNGQVVGDTLPIGAIIPFGGSTPPAGWFLCHGQELSRASYPELYAAIGDAFGGDDERLTFYLPNFKGKVPVGRNSSDTDFEDIGTTGGEKKHTLTTGEMPTHNHMEKIYSKNYNDNKSLSGNRAYARSFADVTGGWNYTVNGESGGQYVDTTETGNSGSGQAHNNLQPYLVTNYIIKYRNIAGLVGGVVDNYSTSHTDSYSCDYVNGAIDDVVEQGRNANGDYIKFENGMLICSSYFGPVETLAGQGAQKIVNFASEFVNDEYSCNISIIGGQAYWADLAYCVNGKTKYGFTLQTWNRGGNTNTGQWFNYIAIGRWK